MNWIKVSAALVVTGLTAIGCGADSKEKDDGVSGDMKMKPATQPAPAPPVGMSTPAPEPAEAAATAAPAAAPQLKEADMTHVVTEEAAYYASSPAQGKPADGTLAAGTKVVLMIPRGSYSQVMTAEGKTVYVSTAGLKPVGK